MSKSRSLHGLDPHIRVIVQNALEDGCTIEKRRRHLALRLPDGSLMPVPSSREGRSDLNLRSALRRKGVSIR